MNSQLIYISTAKFHSALQIPIFKESDPANALHGHTFSARVFANLPQAWKSFKGGESDMLTTEINRAISPLNYNHLNKIIDIPTDENIVRFIRNQLQIPNITQVGVQSTDDNGVDLDIENKLHIWRKYRFESAHYLPNVEKGHQCGRMHGHGFEVVIHCNQTLADNQNMGINYAVIDRAWQDIFNQLNYKCLNDIKGLENPTSEMLSAWIWHKLKNTLPLSWITVYETATAGCHFDGTNYRIWKEQRFESALILSDAPKNHKARNMHGHSYICRLHLSAPLDKIMGWTVDYGDVKSIFKPSYILLDHHRLDTLTSNSNGSLESTLKWIKKQLLSDLPQLDRIDLFNTPGNGASLSWGNLGPALPS